MKWCYIVNNEEGKLGYGMKLMENIILPAKTIELDAANKTYKFTTTDITVTDGVPSGSNWVPVGTIVSDFTQTFTGHIDGQNFKIQGLRIVQNADYTGFIGAMFDDASIRNLILDDAVIKGNSATGVVVGRAQNGTVVENVHVTNSSVTGTGNVGGIAGRNYRRVKTGSFDEAMSYVINCTTDKNTVVIGSGSQIGGVCGENYGAVLINCVNNADVTGKTSVGGVVGQSRDYWSNVEGYTIACGSTAEATITATNGSAGGVVGITVKDNNHENTVSYIVACYSMSSVSAKNAGAFVGSSTNGTITASWAANGVAKLSGYSTLKNESSYTYANAGEVTQSDVDAMNQAIATYNATAGIEQTCPYTWEWTNGSLPVLKLK
jgi:hypothetical protein